MVDFDGVDVEVYYFVYLNIGYYNDVVFDGDFGVVYVGMDDGFVLRYFFVLVDEYDDEAKNYQQINVEYGLVQRAGQVLE